MMVMENADNMSSNVSQKRQQTRAAANNSSALKHVAENMRNMSVTAQTQFRTAQHPQRGQF